MPCPIIVCVALEKPAFIHEMNLSPAFCIALLFAGIPLGTVKFARAERLASMAYHESQVDQAQGAFGRFRSLVRRSGGAVEGQGPSAPAPRKRPASEERSESGSGERKRRKKHTPSPSGQTERASSSPSGSTERASSSPTSSRTTGSSSPAGSEFSDWSMEKDQLRALQGLTRAELRRYKRDPAACAHVGDGLKWRLVQPDDIRFVTRLSGRKLLFPDLYSCYAATVTGAAGTVAAHLPSAAYHGRRRGWRDKDGPALDADARRVVEAIHRHLGPRPGPLRLHLFAHPDRGLRAMARHLEARLRRQPGLHVAAAHHHAYPRVNLRDPDDRRRTNILVTPHAPEGRQVEMKAAWWAEEAWRQYRRHGGAPSGSVSSSAASGGGGSSSPSGSEGTSGSAGAASGGGGSPTRSRGASSS